MSVNEHVLTEKAEFEEGICVCVCVWLRVNGLTSGPRCDLLQLRNMTRLIHRCAATVNATMRLL